jgi:hypothetical protein
MSYWQFSDFRTKQGTLLITNLVWANLPIYYVSWKKNRCWSGWTVRSNLPSFGKFHKTTRRQVPEDSYPRKLFYPFRWKTQSILFEIGHILCLLLSLLHRRLHHIIIQFLYLFKCWAQQPVANYRASTKYKTNNTINETKTHKRQKKNDWTKFLKLKYRLLKYLQNDNLNLQQEHAWL